MKDQSLQNLVSQLNNFDIFYEMSDSPAKIFAGEASKQVVEHQLQYLKIPIDEFTNLLDNAGKAVYDRYFKSNEHKNRI